ncbi:M50 family metallopeptidase [Pullulanibacillus sp. KACC 23026]|uniref:M50 family metallopeptidase n=1 Tax=Pullulanibacillus sp. KACC 23026 TaxID=3028315 RepID=UPI0023B1BE82|nr:M50 family metallopeptidase [Pullulanibacillus sp. KACC 23026]WEG14056.1 M50 family metallopeptidase [Pullulanibacillus sp. KACC 23026]
MIKLLRKCHIHPVFWFVIGGGLLTGHFWDVVTVFFIVFVHEMGHAWAALHYGWRVTQIQLLPFGGVAKVEEHGNRPFKEEFWVTLAGPLQHLWLPILSFLLLKTPYWSEENHHLFMTENALILGFNLLPIWPLDGGKLLFLFLSKFLPFKQAFRQTLILSFLFLVTLSIALFVDHPASINFAVIASFIGLSLYQEWKQQKVVFLRFLLERWRTRPVSRRKIRTLVISKDWPLWRIFEHFFKEQVHLIEIAGVENGELLHESTLLEAYFGGNGSNVTIGEWINVS